jgi:hypothetical protein
MLHGKCHKHHRNVNICFPLSDSLQKIVTYNLHQRVNKLLTCWIFVEKLTVHAIPQYGSSILSHFQLQNVS